MFRLISESLAGVLVGFSALALLGGATTAVADEREDLRERLEEQREQWEDDREDYYDDVRDRRLHYRWYGYRPYYGNFWHGHDDYYGRPNYYYPRYQRPYYYGHGYYATPRHHHHHHGGIRIGPLRLYFH